MAIEMAMVMAMMVMGCALRFFTPQYSFSTRKETFFVGHTQNTETS
jgi:hypothetical protein